MARRVLIVEDDHLNRMFLCTVLQKSGYETEEVSDGARALRAVREFAPHLITMDINLPNISGLELIKMVRTDEEFNHIPILAVTAYVGRGEELAIRMAGADDLIIKPLSIAPFLAKVSILVTEKSVSAT